MIFSLLSCRLILSYLRIYYSKYLNHSNASRFIYHLDSNLKTYNSIQRKKVLKDRKENYFQIISFVIRFNNE